MQFYQHNFDAMGTPCEIQLYAPILPLASAAAAAAVAEVARLEQRYSRYRDDSLLSEINRVAHQGGSITVDEETAGLLNYAAACYQQSGGLFDITSGVLRQAWRLPLQQLPDPALLADLCARIGWRKVQWQEPTLTFSQPGMEIDLGGVVKEYAVDRAAALCWSLGIRHGLINLGGDLKIIGPRADGSPWQIGIRHPREAEGLLQTLSLSSGALASSGDYERCFVVDGERYGHILNPRTGWPVQTMAAVSVVADYCLVAGSAATIGMLQQTQGAAWLAGLGLPHLWVTVDGISGGSLRITSQPKPDLPRDEPSRTGHQV